MASYCTQTDGNLAALEQYQRKQAKLDASHREFERAKVEALVRILKREQAPANDYTGLELIAESLSENTTNVWRPVVSLIADAADGLDSLDDLADAVDCTELGRLMLGVMTRYFDSVTHSRAEEEMASNEADRADYERDEARDRKWEDAA
jgi:hypothetical protein